MTKTLLLTFPGILLATAVYGEPASQTAPPAASPSIEAPSSHNVTLSKDASVPPSTTDTALNQPIRRLKYGVRGGLNTADMAIGSASAQTRQRLGLETTPVSRGHLGGFGAYFVAMDAIWSMQPHRIGLLNG